MSLAELPDPTDATHQHSVADELVLVMEGVYASVQALGSTAPRDGRGGLVDRLITGAR